MTLPKRREAAAGRRNRYATLFGKSRILLIPAIYLAQEEIWRGIDTPDEKLEANIKKEGSNETRTVRNGLLAVQSRTQG